MSEKITFQELIDSIAAETDNSKQFTHDFLKNFVAVVNRGLKRDGNVNIAGFGKFKLRPMDEREGYNPQTGERITIPAHNKVVFKPYKDLRELVNAPYSQLESEIIGEESPEKPPADAASPPPADSDEKGEEAPWEAPEEPAESQKADAPEDPFGLAETGDSTPDERDDDVVEFSPGSEKEEEKKSVIDDFIEEAKKQSESEPASQETDTDPVTVQDDQHQEEPPSYTPSPSSRKKSSDSVVWIAAAVLALLIIVLGIWYFTGSDAQEQQLAETASTGQTTPPAASSQQEQAEEEAEPAQSPPAASAPTRVEDAGEEEQGRTFEEHTVKRGETLWSLSGNQYEDPFLWPWIYDTNQASIGSNPNLIEVGDIINLPVPEEENGLSNSDSLMVAIGYVEAYHWLKNRDDQNAKYYLWAAKNYHSQVFDHIDTPIPDEDLAFANRVR